MGEKKGELKVIEPEKKSVKSRVSPTPEMLIEQAIDKNVSIETMERLLAMRTQLKAEQAKEAFFRDLAQFQAECPVITKNKTVLNKDKKTVRYHFASLDEIVSQIKMYLQKFGFSYTIQTINEKDPDGQRSVCTAHHIEGHSRESEFWTPIDHEAYMSDQQKWASASTYGKRYAFCNAFGILTGDEDNDAQSCDQDEKLNPKENNQTKEPDKSEQKKEWKSKLEEYKKIEQQILVIVDDEDFPDDARTVTVDFLNEKNKNGTKKYHTMENMRKFLTNVKAALIRAKDEKGAQESPEDKGKLDDSNSDFDETFIDTTPIESEQIEL